MTTEKSFDWTSQDLGNIVFFEHINLTCPDFQLASQFYLEGLGLTRDPYDRVGRKTMWVNIGANQIHLVFDERAQVMDGHIGLVVPSLEQTVKSLEILQGDPHVKSTKFSWQLTACPEGYVSPQYKGQVLHVTCPWGNKFRLYQAREKFGPRGGLGIIYVHMKCKPQTVTHLANFYQSYFDADVTVESSQFARVVLGPFQQLILEETTEKIEDYSGWHICIYISKFSRTYKKCSEGKILHTNHRFADKCDTLELALQWQQFRTRSIVDSHQNVIGQLEHEVRSLYHRRYMRTLVNRFGTVGIYCNQ